MWPPAISRRHTIRGTRHAEMRCHICKAQAVDRNDASVRLTPQELRIVRAITTVNSTKEIAALLFLSPRTIEYHLHKVFTKLGICSRTDLIRLIMRNASIIEG